MPKQKSHRGAAKRFSFTKSGIVKHKQMNANHQVHLKTTKRTRHVLVLLQPVNVKSESCLEIFSNRAG